MNREAIRLMYAQLIGISRQTPNVEGKQPYASVSVVKLYNEILTELLPLLSYNLTHLQCESREDAPELGGPEYLALFRSKLGALIEVLYRCCFSDEPHPFGGAPAMSISVNQTATQSAKQSVHQELRVELQQSLDEKINAQPKDSKEREFLEQVKSGLGKVKDYMGFANLVLDCAHKMGLSYQQIAGLFS